MRIENSVPFMPPPFLMDGRNAPPVMRTAAPEGSFAPVNRTGPAFVVDISPEAQKAYAQSSGKAQSGGIPGVEGGSMQKLAALSEPKECQTCKNRKYQDSSDDSSVSFQSPTHVAPGEAASAVAAHESEHVSHEQAKAQQEGRKVISQTVTLQTSVCPECGRIYISGGVTRTITADNNKVEQNAQAGGIDLYA